MADEVERIMIIPLRKTKQAPRTKRAARAVKEVREYVMRHMKTDEDNVWIDASLNDKIWENGIRNPPHKIAVRAVKFDDGLVEVSLAPIEEKKKVSAKAESAAIETSAPEAPVTAEE